MNWVRDRDKFFKRSCKEESIRVSSGGMLICNFTDFSLWVEKKLADFNGLDGMDVPQLPSKEELVGLGVSLNFTRSRGAFPHAIFN